VVFTGQQHGGDIACDGNIIDAAAAFVGRTDHGFQQIGRAFASLRFILQPLARRGDQRIDCLAQMLHAAFQLTVARQFDVAPVGNRATERRATSGRTMSIWRWITSSPPSMVLTSVPKARPAMMSTL
jgi:hypothetical protein